MNILLTIVFTAVFFVLSGFSLAFVYNNKKNDRCLFCGLKSTNSCIKTQCSRKMASRN